MCKSGAFPKYQPEPLTTIQRRIPQEHYLIHYGLENGLAWLLEKIAYPLRKPCKHSRNYIYLTWVCPQGDLPELLSIYDRQRVYSPNLFRIRASTYIDVVFEALN
jgi:hypothetical protein